MKVPSIIEVLNVSPSSTRVDSQNQVSAQSPQTFKESLLAVSTLLQGTGAANQDGIVPNAPAIPRAAPPQAVRQQGLAVQQESLINPALLQLQLLLGDPILSVSSSTVVVGRPMPKEPSFGFLTPASRLLRPDGAKQDSVTSSHVQKQGNPPQVASILPLISDASSMTANISIAVLNPTPSPLFTTVPNVPENAAPKADVSGVTNVVSVAMLNVAQELALNPVPDAVPNITPNPSTSDRNTVPHPVMSTVPVSDPEIAPIPDPGPGSSPLPGLRPRAVPGAVLSPVESAIPSAVRNEVPRAVPGVIEQSASPVVANAIPNASSNNSPVSVLDGVVNPSPKGDTIPKSSPIALSGANPPAAPDPSGLAGSPNIPDATADQLIALLQPRGGLLVTPPAATPSLSPTAVVKPAATSTVANAIGIAGAVSAASGVKQHAQSLSDTGSQESAPSGGQSQSFASPQEQSAVPAQAGSLSHSMTAVDHAPDAVVAPPSQIPPTLIGAAGHAAKTPDTAAPPAIVLPQPAPVINSAKLIQSIGQTEMRVGLRSSDFGNISISTSATRDSISAQISLDHGELARTLAFHLPEMQARLGGAQAMDVRIDMNGQATGQGTGTAANMSNGSAADGSRGERQQKGGAESGQPRDGFTGSVNSVAAAVLTSGEGRPMTGLDIRV